MGEVRGLLVALLQGPECLEEDAVAHAVCDEVDSCCAGVVRDELQECFEIFDGVVCCFFVGGVVAILGAAGPGEGDRCAVELEVVREECGALDCVVEARVVAVDEDERFAFFWVC